MRLLPIRKSSQIQLGDNDSALLKYLPSRDKGREAVSFNVGVTETANVQKFNLLSKFTMAVFVQPDSHSHGGVAVGWGGVGRGGAQTELISRS